MAKYIGLLFAIYWRNALLYFEMSLYKSQLISLMILAGSYVILFIYKASQINLTGFIDVIHILILDISILSL